MSLYKDTSPQESKISEKLYQKKTVTQDHVRCGFKKWGVGDSAFSQLSNMFNGISISYLFLISWWSLFDKAVSEQ